MKRRAFLMTLAATSAVSLAPSMAWAEWKPKRPVNVIVPYKAGGGTDSFARALVANNQGALSVPLVVVNKPGSSGITGATAAAAGKPNGTMVMMTSGGSFVLTSMLRGTKVNPFDSFQTVAQIGNLTSSLMVPNDSPFKTIEDLIKAAKANPGKLRWAHTGRGSYHHVAGQGFVNSTGIEVGDVPFKGGSATRAALIGEQVDFGMIGIQQAAGFQGKMRALALVSDKRDTFATDVPTFAELGYDVPQVSSPIVVFAPNGTPDDVMAGLESALKAITSTPKFAEDMAKRGNAPVFLSGADAKARLSSMRMQVEPIIAAIK